MNRSTARWTTAIAAAALFALPVAGQAQQASPPSPSQSTSRPAGAESGQQGSAHEHLRQAKSALNDIPAASLTGTAKTRVAELKRHLTSLEQSAGASHAAAAPGAAARSTGAGAATAKGWANDVAAVDRIVTELLGAQSATGATEPAGTTGAAGAATTRSTTRAKSDTAITLDDTARTKLQEVRTHVTAFAAAMSSSSGAAASSEPADAAAAPAASPSSATPAARPDPAQATPAEPAPSEPAAAAASPSSPPAASPNPASASSAAAPQAASPSTAPSQPAASAQPDPDTVKRHLTAARDSLSQLTQLPAAAQLSGDARAQVSQLISNFNELITTTTDWRAAHAKVEANLTALLGDQRTDESPTPTAGTPGAVGTSGTVTLDPTIRAKLLEFRNHLVEFEKAAAGSGTGASMASMSPSASSSASTPTSAAAAASTAEPSPSPASAPAASTPSSTASAAAPAATSGSTAATPSPAGTSGTTTPDAGPDAQSKPAAGAQSKPPAGQTSGEAAAKQGHAEAMRHIEAIEAILNGRPASGSTAGTSGAAAAKTTPPATLDRAQIEQIRTHLNELRRAMSQSGR